MSVIIVMMMIIIIIIIIIIIMMMLMMMMIIIIVVVIVITIIAFKGAIRDFLQSPHCAANCLQHVRSSGPGRNRVQITCNTSSTYHVQHVTCHVVRRDSAAIKFDRV